MVSSNHFFTDLESSSWNLEMDGHQVPVSIDISYLVSLLYIAMVDISPKKNTRWIVFGSGLLGSQDIPILAYENWKKVHWSGQTMKQRKKSRPAGVFFDNLFECSFVFFS